MPLELWLAFVGVSAVLLAIPGPTILLVMSYSLAQGRQATLPLVAGVALGDSTALSLSLVGLGSLLATSALWFTLIKWAGGLYLIFLGINLLRGVAKPSPLITATSRHARPAKLFCNAFIVTALNPKGIVFFIALLPQFISAEHAITPQLLILGLTFVLLATIGATSYALFANSIRRLLATARAQKLYAITGGGLLCAAGCWALGAKRIVSPS